MSTDDVFSAFGMVEAVDQLITLAPATEESRPLICTQSRKDAAPFSLQQLAKQHTEQALQTIVDIMNDHEEEGSTRLDAAKSLLDRGWGKPTVQIKQETIKYTLNDVAAKLIEQKVEVDLRVEEARRLESERLGKYITVDAEVIEEPAARSERALQDYS